jgi:NAD(P)-dependent dehydrogenase (short-subunit alcohol dehydrogenase family)
MEHVEGKVAVVTGAASGIGRGLVDRFARAGMKVVLADVQADALEQAAAEVALSGADVLAVQVDVSDYASVERLADATFEHFGTAHILCNNAGVAGVGDAFRGPLSSWQWIIGVNLMGVVHGIHAFLPRLQAQGEGHIVNTASIAGVWPGIAGAYSATKHAVVALTESLYFDQMLQNTGVGVSVLCPGWVRTKINESERNWPSELGALPGSDTDSFVRPIVTKVINEGMPPAAVADVVFDAIASGAFWIFPHPDWVDQAVVRAHGMLDRRNPEFVVFPGMG